MFQRTSNQSPRGSIQRCECVCVHLLPLSLRCSVFILSPFPCGVVCFTSLLLLAGGGGGAHSASFFQNQQTRLHTGEEFTGYCVGAFELLRGIFGVALHTHTRIHTHIHTHTHTHLVPFSQHLLKRRNSRLDTHTESQTRTHMHDAPQL